MCYRCGFSSSDLSTGFQHCIRVIIIPVFSRIALYQASVSGLCDGPSGNLSVRLSVGRSVCLFTKCIVAKRLSGSDPDAVRDGEWGRSRYGCIRWDRDRRRRRDSFGVNLGRPIVTIGQDLVFRSNDAVAPVKDECCSVVAISHTAGRATSI